MKNIMKKAKWKIFLEEKLYKGYIWRPSLTNNFTNSTSVVVSVRLELMLKAKTNKPLFYFLLVWHMIIELVELLTNEEMSNSEPTDVVLDLN